MAEQPTYPPRPKNWDKAIIREACAALLPDVRKWLGDEGTDSSDDEVLADLIGAADDFNGYQFARNLESNSYWSPDAELVEILSGYSTYYPHKNAVKIWVSENTVVVPYGEGQRCVYRKRPGAVRKVEPETAEVIFVPDDEQAKYGSGGGLIVAFEDLAIEPVTP